MDNFQQIIIFGKKTDIEISLKTTLQKEGFQSEIIQYKENLLRLLTEKSVPVILTYEDNLIYPIEDLLKDILKISQDTRIILLEPSPTIESLKTNLSLGAYDYIKYPLKDTNILLDVLKRAVSEFNLLQKQRNLIEEVKSDAQHHLVKFKDYLTDKEHLELDIMRSLSVELSACRDSNKAILLTNKYIEELFKPDVTCIVVNDDDKMNVYIFSSKLDKDIQFLYVSMENCLTLHGIFRNKPIKNSDMGKIFLNGIDQTSVFKEKSQKSIQHIESHITFPLISAGKNIGCISITSIKKEYFNISDVKVLYLISYQLASALQSNQLINEIKQLAIRDPLTGLYNRRHFEELFDHEFFKAKRYSLPLSLIMIDIDMFKTINDTFGHMVGDEILKEVAKIIEKTTRKVDIPARYGGEEFIIGLPNTFLDEATLIAERLRITIQGHIFPFNELKLNLTISGGVATLSQNTNSKEDMINLADEALLISKSSGRNRICMYVPEEGIREVKGINIRERRRFPRAKINIPLRYVPLSYDDLERLNATSKDISEIGIRFYGKKGIQEGEFALLDLTIPLEDKEKEVRALAQVIWSQKVPDDENIIMGAKITPINPDDRKLLRKLVYNLNKKDKTNT